MHSEGEFCAKEVYCQHSQFTFDSQDNCPHHIQHRVCKQLRVDEQGFNQRFKLRMYLTKHTSVSFGCNSSWKVLTEQNFFDDFDLFEKAICYAEESELEYRVNNHYSKCKAKFEDNDLFDRKENAINQISKAGLKLLS
uniref:Uncharacterized protein n=1 Tax=Rhabditophanes sp. KR3021 TaxID=114890 RepID=A0AC35U128_9BILA